MSHDGDSKLRDLMQRNRPMPPAAGPSEADRIWQNIQRSASRDVVRSRFVPRFAVGLGMTLAIALTITVSTRKFQMLEVISSATTIDESLNLAFLDDDEELDEIAALVALAE